MVCLRNISVDTLHREDTEGDDDDDDDDDDNNNNNNNNNNTHTHNIHDIMTFYNLSTKFLYKTPLNSAQWQLPAPEQLTVSISLPNSCIIQFEPGFNTRAEPASPPL